MIKYSRFFFDLTFRYKNGQWEHVVVDDYFPCLADNQSDGLCAGAAFAHSDHMEEIWIALLEKAFAKYGKSVFTCWWYSLCTFQYRQQYENTCSYNVDC